MINETKNISDSSCINIGDDTTYEYMMKNIKQTTFFWEYYINYPRIAEPPLTQDQIKDYNLTYENTKQILEKEPIKIFEKFIDAWLSDTRSEIQTIGPEFTLQVYYHFRFDEYESEIDMYDEWFVGAAVYDMVYDILLVIENNNKYTKLKHILDMNPWVQQNIISFNQ